MGSFSAGLVALLLVLAASRVQAQFLCPTARTAPGDTLPEWVQPKPAFLTTFIDSNYATCFQRITNAAADGDEYAPLYSQLQAFNSDGTKLLLKDGQILNVADWTPYKQFPHTANGMRWSPADPNVIYYIDNTGTSATWKSRNIVTDIETVHRSFPEYPGGLDVQTSHEEISVDGRMVALIGYKGASGDDSRAEIFAYDMVADRKGTTSAARGGPGACGGADVVSMSPSGKFVIVAWGKGSADVRNCGFAAYDTAMSYVGKIACGGGHFDTVLMPDGTEWLVFFTTGSGCSVGGDGSWNGPYLAKAKIPNGRDLYQSGHTGAMVKLVRWSDNLGGGHVSGQARGFPWVIVSADQYGPETPRVPFDNEILRIFMDSKVSAPHVERLADTRSYPGRIQSWTSCKAGHYWAQPHATVSRDGTRVVWGSAWSSGGGGSAVADCRVDTYAMEISNRGFNATLLNLPVNRWTKLNPDAFRYDGSPSGPSGKHFVHNSYSGAVFAPEFGAMLLFGGGGHGERLGNDVWLYDTEKNEFHQWTLPDSFSTYPSAPPHRESFRSYAGTSVPVDDRRYLTHSRTGSVYQTVPDPIVPSGSWEPLGTTARNQPWSSHSYDQLAWNSRERKMLFWGPNFCTGLCMGEPRDSIAASMSQSALYFGSKSAHLFSPFTRKWENVSGNRAPDLYHQTGSTAYDPVRKIMLAVNRSRWASAGGGLDEASGGDRSGVAAVQDAGGVWKMVQSPPRGTGNTWRNATLTYVRSAGSFYTFHRGDMYRYDAGSDSWSVVPTHPDPKHGSPPSSGDPYTVYSSKDDKVLVRGCRESKNCLPTWILDVPTGRWRRMNPPAEPWSSEDTNWFSPTVYDPINNVFLMTRRAARGGNVGIGDNKVTSGSRGELWAYKLSQGSGAGRPRRTDPAPQRLVPTDPGAGRH